MRHVQKSQKLFEERITVMDPISLIVLAASYAGAAVAQKAAEKPVEEGWHFIASYIGNFFDGQNDPPVNEQAVRAAEADRNAGVLEEARRIIASTPALRRAGLVAPILRHARILWVDDNPENNAHEREALLTLGTVTDIATSTGAGMAALRTNVYDLVISDMRRGSAPDEGLVLLEKMRKIGFPQRVVFYVGTADPEKGRPAGSFGITDRPDELLHLIMDILERQRV